MHILMRQKKLIAAPHSCRMKRNRKPHLKKNGEEEEEENQIHVFE